MSAERYIVIPNWDGFQHYKDRTPKWIKNYSELLSDDAYLGLTGHERGVLHGLWLEYAAARCQLRDDTLTITRRLGLRVTRTTLDALNHAGFIEFSASTPLAKVEPRLEVEVEKKVSKTPRSKTESAEFIIRTMIDNGAIHDQVDLEAELRARGLNGDTEQRLRASLTAKTAPTADDDIDFGG